MARLAPTRDSVTTIRKDGSRFFLHPADSRGRWTTARRLVALVLIGIYAILPWVLVGGYPAVFLDVLNRRFHLFGWTLAAQDIWLLFFGITGVAFSLFFVTALIGRVWCGWACPQTVFLEHVFRRIERWIEGEAVERKRLDAASWTMEKGVKRIVKHGLFLVVALVIAHVFLAYFISIPQLWEWVRHSPAEHWKTFVFVVLFTLVLYGNFAWFREQLCLIICPYGRLQSVLVDDDTINVAYDDKRGEPRGKAGHTTGDCIDCFRCVQVCPTGIDIRQGLQMECVACTACIDACDEVMDRLNRPRGLIRYASLNALGGKRQRFARPRVLLYSVMLLLGLGVAGASLSQVKTVEVFLSRMRGMPYYATDTGVRNQYIIRVVSKETKEVTLKAVLVDTTGYTLVGGGESFTIQAMGEIEKPLVVRSPIDEYAGPRKLTLELQTMDGVVMRTIEADFLGPTAELVQKKFKTE